MPTGLDTTYCPTLGQTLTQNQNDYATKCSTQNLSDKTAAKENEFQTYIDQQQALLNGESTVFDSLFETLLLSNKTQAPVIKYQSELENQKKALETENYRLHQGIRAGRRRFMDADPQTGVANIGGLRTTDDKIVLTFWIGYAFFLLISLFIFLRIYGDTMGLDTGKKRLGFGTVVFGLLFGLAYYCIYRFA